MFCDAAIHQNYSVSRRTTGKQVKKYSRYPPQVWYVTIISANAFCSPLTIRCCSSTWRVTICSIKSQLPRVFTARSPALEQRIPAGTIQPQAKESLPGITPTTIDGMIAKVWEDPALAKYKDNPAVRARVEAAVNTAYAKYQDVFDRYLPIATQTGGTAGALAADLLYFFSGGIGGFVKLYTVGSRAALELPTMLRIAEKEGAYQGTVDIVTFFAKKAASFFVPFIGPLLDLGSVKNYAREAVAREAIAEAREYVRAEVTQPVPEPLLKLDDLKNAKLSPGLMERLKGVIVGGIIRPKAEYDKRFYGAAAPGLAYAVG